MKYLFLLLFIFASSLFSNSFTLTKTSNSPIENVQNLSCSALESGAQAAVQTIPILTETECFNYGVYDGTKYPFVFLNGSRNITISTPTCSPFGIQNKITYTQTDTKTCTYSKVTTCKLSNDFFVESFSSAATCQSKLPYYQSKYPNQANSFYCSGCLSASGAQVSTMYQQSITCPSGQNQKSVPDGTANVLTCSSNIPVNIPAKNCQGNITNYDKGVSGALVLDSTGKCSMTELLAIPCSKYTIPIASKLSKCDPDLNNFKFTCTDGVGIKPTTFTNNCTSRNDSTLSSPCDESLKKIQSTCLSGEVVDGACKDNGLKIISNSFKCIKKKPNCLLPFNEEYDLLTNTCKCLSGFSRDNFGSCWQDSNTSDFTSDQNLSLKLAQQKNSTDRKKYADKKGSSSVGSPGFDKNGSISSNLSGIRRDLNTTNNLLSSIKNGTFVDTSGFTQTINNGNDPLMKFLANAKNGVGKISTDFTSLKTLVDNGFKLTKLSSGTAPSFSAVVYGKTINVDLCTTFSKFYPIFSFVFTLMFMYISIRIFLFAFLINI